LKTRASDKMGEAIITNNIGEALLQQNGYTEALGYFREARRKAHELKFNDLEAHTWLMEAKASEGLKDFSKAYAAISGYLEIHDQVLNEKRIKAIEELQTKYETDKKEQENILLQQQNQVQALELGQRKIIIMALLTVVLLIAGISYLLYTRSRLRQQARMSETLRQQQTLRTQAVIEAEEHERQRLARELHDGIGQMLAATRRSLQVSDHAYQHTGAATTEPLTLIDESIRELRQLSHQMMPPSLRNKNLVEALTELLERISQSTAMNIHTSWTGMESTILDKTQTLMLYRTVQEILSNTIRHANASEVHVELVSHDTELNLMVYDNGKGFDLEDVYAGGRGLGLKNIRSRIAYIGGELELDATPGNGTTYMINLPLQKPD
jgi:two-component system NarL family sensor kinase